MKYNFFNDMFILERQMPGMFTAMDGLWIVCLRLRFVHLNVFMFLQKHSLS